MLWERILLKWCNCLELSRPVEEIDDLRDGVFFSNILGLIEKSEDLKEGEEALKTLISVLNSNYAHCQLNFEPDSRLQNIPKNDLIVLASLLMHYTCMFDQKDALTSPLCYKLSKNTQLCIKNFLQLVKKEITRKSMEKIIQQFSSNDNSEQKMNINNDTNSSPLIGIFATPPAKLGKFHEKDRELTKLKRALETERVEKEDLQEELKLQIEEMKNIENLSNQKDAQISQLKRKIIELECKTPPHFQSNNSEDTEKRLRKEIQSLEHYIDKTEKEQEDLREESFRNKKKLAEWELEFANLQVKYMKSEEQLNQLSHVNKEQTSKIFELESTCNELKNILEEYKNHTANESSVFETCSFTAVEENLASSVVEIQLEEANRKNEELCSENKQLKKEIDGINLKLEKSDEEKQKLTEEINSLSILLQDRISEINRVNSENELINSKIKQLESDFEESEAQNKKIEADLLTMKIRNENLDGKIKSLEDSINQKNLIITGHELTIMNYKDKCVQYEGDVNEFKSQLEESTHNAMNLRSALQKRDEECEKINFENKEFISKLKCFESDNEKLKEELEALTIHLEKSKETNKNLENNAENKDIALQIISSEKEEMKMELGKFFEINQCLKKTIEDKNLECQNMSLEVKDNLLKIHYLEDEIHLCSIQIEHLKTEIDSKDETYNSLLRRNTENLFKLKGSEDEKCKLEMKIKEITSEKEAMNQHSFILKQFLQATLAEKQELISQLTLENSNLSVKLSDSEEKIKHLTSEIEDRNEEVNNLIFNNNECIYRIETLQNDCSKLEKKNETLTCELIQTEERNMNFISKIQSLEIILQEKENELKKNDLEIEILEETKREYLEKLQYLEESLKEKTINFESLGIENEKNIAEIENLKQHCEENKENVRECLNKIQSLEDLIEVKNDELEQVVYSTKKYIEKIQSLEEECQKFSTIVNERTLEIKQIETVNAELTAIIQGKISEHEYLESENKKLSSKLDNFVTQNEELKSQLSGLEINLNDKTSNFEQKEEMLTRKINELCNEKEKDMEKLEKIVNMRDNFLSQISSLRALVHETDRSFNLLKADFLMDFKSLGVYIDKIKFEKDALNLNLKKAEEEDRVHRMKIDFLENDLKVKKAEFVEVQLDLENKLKQSNEAMKLLEIDYEKLTDENIKSDDLIKEYVEKINSLQSQQDELNTCSENYKKDYSDTLNKLQLLENTIEEKNININTLKSENEQLEMKNQEILVELATLEEKLKTYEEKIQQLTKISEKTTVEKNEKQEQITKLEAKVEGMISEIERLQNNINLRDEELTLLKKLSEESMTKLTHLESEAFRTKEELSQLKKKIGKTQEEYESTFANLQVKIVSSKLEVSEFKRKYEESLEEKKVAMHQLKDLEVENHEFKNLQRDIELKQKENISLKKELEDKEIVLKELLLYKEKAEKHQADEKNLKFLEEKQVELQQKIQTLMEGNDLQKITFDEFKEKYRIFKNGLDKLLSQKNILDNLTNNLRLATMNVCNSTSSVNYNIKKLMDKKEDLEVITEDIIKQNNKYSKQVSKIVFEIVNYYQRNCDSILTTLDLKLESYTETYNLEELHQEISDLTDRAQDALDQVKMLQKDLDDFNKVREELNENILVESNKINVVKMKEDELKKKNLQLRQKVTLLENSKSNLEKTLKKLREENKKIKENTNIIDNDVHYKMLLQEHIEYKENQEKQLKIYQIRIESLQKELEDIRRTSTPIEKHFSLTENESSAVQADLANLREAYSSIMALNAKLEAENMHSKKLAEEQKQELNKVHQIKEAYDKLLEENNKLMTDVDTMKYKRTRDRDEYVRLLKKERSDNEAKNLKQIQNIKAEYEAKLERMKDKMIQSYREEVSKEMHKLQDEQYENSSLLTIIDQLKRELIESEQKIQALETERESLKRSKDSSNLYSSRDSLTAHGLHDSDNRSFPVPSSSSSRKLMEFKHPSKVNPSGLDTRRQYDERRSSTLPRTITEEIVLSRKTSYGFPNAMGKNIEMEDEEEMFNNKYLADLKQGNCNLPPSSDDRGSRVSELAWRNSLVPPHLKSSYPAETQFCSPERFKEDELKTGDLAFEDSLCKLLPGDKPRKKDFGTTSYKKPGPPTPSKNGGRLSLQGNEVHPGREANTETKRSTPSRIRALFTGRSSMKGNVESSPAKRRLNIFRR